MLALLPLLFSTAVQPKTPAVNNLPSRTLVTACGAVTQTDVESEIGRRVSRGVESDSGSTCDYTGSRGIVTVRVQRLSTIVDFDAEIASLRTAMPRARITSVAGIGSRAVLLDLPNAGTQLHVIRQGTVYVMISVLGFGEASEVSRGAEALARRVLDMI